MSSVRGSRLRDRFVACARARRGGLLGARRDLGLGKAKGAEIDIDVIF